MAQISKIADSWLFRVKIKQSRDHWADDYFYSSFFSSSEETAEVIADS